MKHECVNKYNPGYPTREQTLNNPMLLKNTPDRWKEIALVCTAMSALTLSSCSVAGNIITKTLPLTPPPQLVGSVVMPIYVLSEEAAISIIADEAAINGVQFETETTYEVNTKLPVDITYDSSKGYVYYELKTKLAVDGKVKDKDICFEYISENDFASFTNDSLFNDQYRRIDFMRKYLDSKENKQSLIGDKGEIVKVFNENFANDRTEAESTLRQQVKEFIDQLKEQRVI